MAYDPCYHSACDTIDNVNLTVLDQMADAAAHATWSFAQTTSAVNGTSKASAKTLEAGLERCSGGATTASAEPRPATRNSASLAVPRSAMIGAPGEGRRGGFMRRRGGLLAAVVFVLVACGPAAPAALPLGKAEAVVRQGDSAGSGDEPGHGPRGDRAGCPAGHDRRAGGAGFSLDEDEKSLVPMYVDARFENKGSETISRQQRVGMENQDG